MNKSLEQVQEFHQVFNHPVGNLTEFEPLQVRQLRIKLLFEELEELAKASDCMETFVNLCIEPWERETTSVFSDDPEVAGILYDSPDGDNVNQLEELDALCDLQYVLNGKIITAGMHEIFDREFDLVHQNNMSKAHNSWLHAEQTIQSIPKEEKYQILGINPNTFVLTNSSGKVIKPHDHKKVQLSLNP